MPGAREQIRQSFIYLLTAGMANLVPLAALPLLTRALTREEFGILALAQFYAAFAAALANFGLVIGYERNFFEARDPRRSAALLYSTLAFVAASLGLVLVLTWILRLRLSGWIIGSPAYGYLLVWATAATGIMSFKNYYLTYFRNTGEAGSYARYSVDETVLGAVLSVLLVVYVRLGVLGMITGQLVASLVVLAVVGVRVARRLPPALDGRLLLTSLRLSYPLTPRLFLNLVGAQFDKYLINLLSSLGGVGLYSIAQRIASASFQFVTALGNVFVPRTYRMMFERGGSAAPEVGRYLTTMAYIALSVPLGLALFGEEVLRWLTPPAYHPAGAIVAVLSLYYGWLFFSKVNAAQIIYRGRTAMTSVVSAVHVGAVIGLNLVFIPRWGPLGAAWAVLGAGLVSGGLAWIVGQRCYPIIWNRRRLTILLAVFFGAGLTLALLAGAEAAYGIRLAAKLAWVTGYAAIGVWSGLITRQRVRDVGAALTQRPARIP